MPKIFTVLELFDKRCNFNHRYVAFDQHRLIAIKMSFSQKLRPIPNFQMSEDRNEVSFVMDRHWHLLLLQVRWNNAEMMLWMMIKKRLLKLSVFIFAPSQAFCFRRSLLQITSPPALTISMFQYTINYKKTKNRLVLDK